MQTKHRHHALRLVASTVLLTLALFVVLFAVKGEDPVSADADLSNRVITTGHAEVRAVPDMAKVVIGVETMAKTAEEAQNAAAERAEKVTAALRAQGIAEKDLQTRNLRVGPEYDYSDQKRVIVGYTASYDLNVTINNLEALGPVVDAAIAAGASVVNSVSFEVSDASKLQLSAMKEAVKNAKVKAAALADGAGIEGLRIVSIRDQSARIIPQTARDGFGALNMVKAEAATPILPGEMSITADVEVEFTF